MVVDNNPGHECHYDSDIRRSDCEADIVLVEGEGRHLVGFLSFTLPFCNYVDETYFRSK